MKALRAPEQKIPLTAPELTERDFVRIIRVENRKLFWMDIGFGVFSSLLAIYIFLLITGKA